MIGKKRAQKGLRRVAISSSEKSIDDLDKLSEHLGLDLSNSITLFLEEFIQSAEVRHDFDQYREAFDRIAAKEVGRTGLFRNYMIPTSLLDHRYLEKVKAKYGLSDFVRTLIYFNHDRRLFNPGVDIQKEVIDKIEKTGLKINGFTHMGKVLNVLVDLSPFIKEK